MIVTIEDVRHGKPEPEGYNKAWLEAVDQIGIENYYERVEL